MSNIEIKVIIYTFSMENIVFLKQNTEFNKKTHEKTVTLGYTFIEE